MASDRNEPPLGVLLERRGDHDPGRGRPAWCAVVDTREGTREDVIADCHERDDRLRDEGRKAANADTEQMRHALAAAHSMLREFAARAKEYRGLAMWEEQHERVIPGYEHMPGHMDGTPEGYDITVRSDNDAEG